MAALRRSVLVLAVLASACAGVDDQLSDLRDRVADAGQDAAQVRDRAQFCLAVTRTLAAADGGTPPEQARAAAEEVLAQVPGELRDDAALVADRLRRAAEDGDRAALDERFRQAGQRLHDRTRQLCDPRR